MDRKKENLKVSELVLEHNHALHLPETLHLMVSERKITELQAFEIEMADDAGIGPKTAHELASRQVGGPLNLATPFVIARTTSGPSGNERWDMGKLALCLSIFKTKLLKINHSNMHFKWILMKK
jgi:hypothetical protein